MLMDLFIVPRKAVVNEDKAKRTVESSMSVVHQHYLAQSWSQINKTIKTSLYYGVAFDNEWFDPRLIKDLQAVLIYARDIDMFSVFTAEGDGNVIFQPRIFRSELKLNPDIPGQPLPYEHQKRSFEKLIGGWLYID
jgi:hypothetical protein